MKQTYTIYAVTADADLGKRIQDALRIPELKTEIGSNFPIAQRDRDSVDLLILDGQDEDWYTTLGEIRKDKTWGRVGLIVLMVKTKTEKDIFMACYQHAPDMYLYRDFNPKELCSFVLRILKSIKEESENEMYTL